MSSTRPGTLDVSWGLAGDSPALPKNSRKLRSGFPCIDACHVIAHAKAPLQEKCPIKLFQEPVLEVKRGNRNGHAGHPFLIPFLFSSVLFSLLASRLLGQSGS
jgi:hypothetical protein